MNVPLVSVEVSWNFTFERVNFEASFEGPILAPIPKLLTGNIKWNVIDWSSRKSSETLEWFKSEIWRSR